MFGIGKYILGLVVLFLSTVYLLQGIRLTQPAFISIIVVLTIPLFLLFNKNLLRGIVYMLIASLSLNFILPVMGMSYGSSYPTIMSTQDTRTARRNFENHSSEKGAGEYSTDGKYSGDIGGAIATMIIIGDKWYGENHEESFGELLGSGTGTLNGNDILDQYGTKIGNVKNGKVKIIIGGESFTLYRD